MFYQWLRMGRRALVCKDCGNNSKGLRKSTKAMFGGKEEREGLFAFDCFLPYDSICPAEVAAGSIQEMTQYCE